MPTFYLQNPMAKPTKVPPSKYCGNVRKHGIMDYFIDNGTITYNCHAKNCFYSITLPYPKLTKIKK